MNKAALIALAVAVSLGGIYYFPGSQPTLTHEQEFLRQGAILQEDCRTGNLLKFRDQLMRVTMTYRMAKPEMERKSSDRCYLFEAALSRWNAAKTLLNMQDQGEVLISPQDFPNWTTILGKETFAGRADGLMTEELIPVAMKKGSQAFQTAEECIDPKKERERVDAETH